MTSATNRQVYPLTNSQKINLPTPSTSDRPMSALSGIVSSDPMWNINGVREDEEDEEPELPQLYFHYAGNPNLKPEVKQDTEIKHDDRRQSREKDDKANEHHEKLPSAGIGLGRPRGLHRTYSDASDTHTPPHVTGSGFSTHSSASSARIGSLTDASTVSHSSMEPTPPSVYGHLGRSSLSSNGSGGGSVSGGSGDRPLGRTYGGSSARTFSRHVSAPLARHWPTREDKSRDTEEVRFIYCRGLMIVVNEYIYRKHHAHSNSNNSTETH